MPNRLHFSQFKTKNQRSKRDVAPRNEQSPKNKTVAPFPCGGPVSRGRLNQNFETPPPGHRYLNYNFVGRSAGLRLAAKIIRASRTSFQSAKPTEWLWKRDATFSHINDCLLIRGNLYCDCVQK